MRMALLLVSFVLCVNVYVLGSGYSFPGYLLPTCNSCLLLCAIFTLISFCCMLNLKIKCHCISMLCTEMGFYLHFSEKKKAIRSEME
jgi:hypothetical protein